MAKLAVRESVTLAGRAERARVARAFVSRVLGSGHPCGDMAVLLVSELFGNSVRHSGSGPPGETVTVVVRTGRSVVRVEVIDRGGAGGLSCTRLAGMRKLAGVFSCCGPCGAVGLAAARRADSDLVRAIARLTTAPDDVAHMPAPSLFIADCQGVELLRQAGVEVVEMPKFADVAMAPNRHLNL